MPSPPTSQEHLGQSVEALPSRQSWRSGAGSLDPVVAEVSFTQVTFSERPTATEVGRFSRSVRFLDSGQSETSSSGDSRTRTVCHEDSHESRAAREDLAMDVNEIMRSRGLGTSEVLHYEDGCYLDLLLLAFGFMGSTVDDEEATQRRSTYKRSTSLRGICYRAATSLSFQIFFGGVLAANLVILTVEADVNVHRAEFPDSKENDGFVHFNLVADHIFTVLFLTEIVIRVVGSTTKPWRDGWLVTDATIVALSILEIWILAIIYSQDNGTLSSLTAFRGIRVLRATRAFRTVRIFRYVSQLRLMAEAIGDALRQIFWILVVTFFATWCFAIVLVEGVNPWSVKGWDPSELSESEPHPSQELPHMMFERVTSSLLLLQLLMVRGVLWGPRIVDPMLSSEKLEYISVGVLILIFVIGITACILNIVRGVFMSSLLEAAQRDHSWSWRQSLVSGEVSVGELKKAFRQFDRSGNGALSKQDFVYGVAENPGFFAKFGLRIQKADVVFRLLDGNRSGVLTMDEFLIGCLKLVSSSRSLDSMCTDYMITKANHQLFKLGQRYERDYEMTKTSMDKLDHDLQRLSSSAEQLVKEGCKSFQGECEDDGDEVERNEKRLSFAPGGSDQVLADLEHRFSFSSRLQVLSQNLSKELRPEGLVLDEGAAAPWAPADEAVSTGGPSLTGRLWDELLFKEALPWVREHMASMQTRTPTPPPTVSTAPAPEAGSPTAGVASATPPAVEAVAATSPAAAKRPSSPPATVATEGHKSTPPPSDPWANLTDWVPLAGQSSFGGWLLSPGLLSPAQGELSAGVRSERVPVPQPRDHSASTGDDGMRL